jgi:phosphoribosylamine--glycine ligase
MELYNRDIGHKDQMKVLIVGGGGREHTLAWKLAQSPKVNGIYTAPGNAGTSQLGENLDISANDIKNLLVAAKNKDIDLTVVGPEAPLAAGIVDYFKEVGLKIFGPTRAAAQIEASKSYARELMNKYKIPCAKGEVFSSYAEARKYLEKQTPPLVVKADGLAAGKGVTVAQSIPQALEALDNIMVKKAFGIAGDNVIIEECLQGYEMSFIAFCNGVSIAPMVPACDYKRIYDGGRGPNTGGMGCYSPPFFYSPTLTEQIMDTIMRPTVRALVGEDRGYLGVLYAGLMLTREGPRVMEFNARFGDPETQVVLPLLQTDLADIMLAVIDNKLDEINIQWNNDACVGVVMASSGYPGTYEKGKPISGLEELGQDILVFHAGTKLDINDRVITSGGRVLSVVATSKSLQKARQQVYANLLKISFEGCHYRQDIAKIEVD